MLELLSIEEKETTKKKKKKKKKGKGAKSQNFPNAPENGGHHGARVSACASPRGRGSFTCAATTSSESTGVRVGGMC